MGLKDAVENWVLKIALKKAVKAAVASIIAFAASAKVAPILVQYGLHIDPAQLELGMTAAGTGAVVAGMNWLKMKTKLGAKFL